MWVGASLKGLEIYREFKALTIAFETNSIQGYELTTLSVVPLSVKNHRISLKHGTV